jgi:hypothetical protein
MEEGAVKGKWKMENGRERNKCQRMGDIGGELFRLQAGGR